MPRLQLIRQVTLVTAVILMLRQTYNPKAHVTLRTRLVLILWVQAVIKQPQFQILKLVDASAVLSLKLPIIHHKFLILKKPLLITARKGKGAD